LGGNINNNRFMNKQQEISNYLAKVKVATLEQIYDNISFGYYHNGHKYLGEILSRMVKTKKIERIKKGLFRWIDAVEYVNKIRTFNGAGSLF
jgi:hypothetical protein